jgi:hypothetical protein
MSRKMVVLGVFLPLVFVFSRSLILPVREVFVMIFLTIFSHQVLLQKRGLRQAGGPCHFVTATLPLIGLPVFNWLQVS